MMISFLICPWKPASEWESCDKAAASSRRSICFWERRNADLRESDKREKEIKAREILSLVICMMRIKAFKGEKSSGRRIGKGGRGWSRMGGSRAVVGIFVQGDERVIRSPQCFVFLLAIPWSSSHGKKRVFTLLSDIWTGELHWDAILISLILSSSILNPNIVLYFHCIEPFSTPTFVRQPFLKKPSQMELLMTETGGITWNRIFLCWILSPSKPTQCHSWGWAKHGTEMGQSGRKMVEVEKRNLCFNFKTSFTLWGFLHFSRAFKWDLITPAGHEELKSSREWFGPEGTE